MAVGSSDPTTPPLFLIIAVSWNETFDHSDYPQTPKTPQTTPELAVKSITPFFRFLWTRLKVDPAPKKTHFFFPARTPGEEE